MQTTLAIIMAGGLGERLKPLTMERAKAAVPFGGKFRIIDFTLSNCINSGIRHIFVLTQYRSESLNRHVQEGWGISSSGLGEFIYSVPAQQKLGTEWYRGTADAVRQNLNLIKRGDVTDVLILSGDHIYKMDYMQMLAFHRSHNADASISAVRVKKDHAARALGVLEINTEYALQGFEEKPEEPKTIPDAPDYCFASMGVYIFKVDSLIEALKQPGDDFGKDVLPRLKQEGSRIFVYDYARENRIEEFIDEIKDGKRKRVLVGQTRDSSYWKDVGTIASYYEASMDLVGVEPLFNLYGRKWALRTYQRQLPPTKFIIGGKTLESIVCDGCIISGGTVWSSIISPGVIVEKDAYVEQSIIFDDVIIEPRARIRRAIIDKEARIQSGMAIGYDHEADRRRGCTVSETGIVVVPKGADIGL